MTNIARYTNGHLFSLYTPMTDLEKQIATKLGALTAKDFDDVKKFGDRILKISAYSSERNCQLYVDAEQTFIQAGIESFG